MKSFAKFAVAAAAVLSFGAQAGVTIDNFNTMDQTVSDGPAIDGVGVWSQAAGLNTDIIGGYRDIFAMKTAGVTVGSTKTLGGGRGWHLRHREEWFRGSRYGLYQRGLQGHGVVGRSGLPLHPSGVFRRQLV